MAVWELRAEAMGRAEDQELVAGSYSLLEETGALPPLELPPVSST